MVLMNGLLIKLLITPRARSRQSPREQALLIINQVSQLLQCIAVLLAPCRLFQDGYALADVNKLFSQVEV
jgi:hypothetical protein